MIRENNSRRELTVRIAMVVAIFLPLSFFFLLFACRAINGYLMEGYGTEIYFVGVAVFTLINLIAFGYAVLTTTRAATGPTTRREFLRILFQNVAIVLFTLFSGICWYGIPYMPFS
jgi:hypothetical protein